MAEREKGVGEGERKAKLEPDVGVMGELRRR